MQASNAPSKSAVPFAESGTKNTIPVASQIGVTPGAASFTDGFPPLTMTPLAAGGVPPHGADFNGILNFLSEATRWAQAGGSYGYDSAFATSVGGYPKGAVLLANDGLSLWISTVDGNVQDFNSGTPTQWARIAFSGLDALLDTKADKAVSINAGTGLTGGGNLSANRTLSVNYGTTAGTAAQGNDSRITGAAQKSANLSDLANPVAARTNLGLDALLNTKADKDSFASSLTANGWQKLQSGLIIQWGTATVAAGANGAGSVTFPLAFPSSCVSLSLSCLDPVGTGNTIVEGYVFTTGLTNTGATFRNKYIGDSNGTLTAATFYWIAIGY